MPKRMLKIFLFFLLMVPFFAPSVLSFEISASNAMSFGGVAPGPGNAEVQIDARAGFARPTILSGAPILTPPLGYSGLLRVTSNSTEAGSTINFVFPSSILLVLENSIETPLNIVHLDNFSSLSPASEIAVQGDLDIAFGGRLKIKEYQNPGSYFGDLTITVVFN